MSTHNLLGLTLPELSTFAETIGEERYRCQQLFQWLYAKGANSFEAMSNLSMAFRGQLQASARIDALKLIAQQRSRQDGTTKFLFELPDGLKIESVLILPASAFVGNAAAAEDEQTRLTLCVSTQVGCPLDCKFCATATMGYRRNLTAGEIVDQILHVRRLTGKKLTNVVFMGMGEPLMNYDNLMKAIGILIDGVNIAARRITVSTAGWVDGITRMADERRKTKLAVSLHSADDEIRSRLMPINRKYNLQALLSALEDYYAKTKLRVTYEYIFFHGLNDSDRAVAQLVKLARRVPCKINIIPFHSIDFAGPEGIGSDLRPSARMAQIVDHLRASNLTVMVRSSAGEDIDAACGQLAVKMERRVNRAAQTGHPEVLTPA